jgi:hypothetical protein
VWKVNTLYFDELFLGGFHEEVHGTRVGAVEEAIGYFVRNVGIEASKRVRSLEFRVYVPDSGASLKTFLDSLLELIKPFSAQVRILDTSWKTHTGYRHGTALWEAGPKYKEALAKVGYGDKNARNWRIFPLDAIKEPSLIELGKVLDKAQMAEALDWIKNGI